MHRSIHATRLARSPRTRLLAAATLITGVLVAGCGGSSHNPTAPTAASATTPTTNRVSSSSAGPGAGTLGPLAFAKCMRSSGVPDFPDPTSSGEFLFSNTAGINPAAPAFQAAQAKCRKLLPNGGPPGPGSTTHPSTQILVKLDKIARCMRQHDVPQFPDPRTSVPSNPLAAGIREITNFDGAILLFPATINMQAPAYKQALAACGAPPLGLSH